MTPAQILEEAKSRFIVLYHNNPEALERLLYQALGKFQDKAGIIQETWSKEPVFMLPPLFHAVAGCSDSKRRHVPWRWGFDESGQKIIALQTCSRHQAPYCLLWFCHLRKWARDEDLPGDCDALLADYLEALIAVPNTRREREADLQAGMNESAQALPTEQELKQRIVELEKEMEDNKAIIPPASMF